MPAPVLSPLPPKALRSEAAAGPSLCEAPEVTGLVSWTGRAAAATPVAGFASRIVPSVVDLDSRPAPQYQAELSPMQSLPESSSAWGVLPRSEYPDWMGTAAVLPPRRDVILAYRASFPAGEGGTPPSARAPPPPYHKPPNSAAASPEAACWPVCASERRAMARGTPPAAREPLPPPPQLLPFRRSGGGGRGCRQPAAVGLVSAREAITCTGNGLSGEPPPPPPARELLSDRIIIGRAGVAAASSDSGFDEVRERNDAR